ncbi:A49-like RNA polymerase I associated factor-domain-containing protein [Schizophyllum commune]
MQTKLLTHMFALCLRVDNCATDSAQLATDLQMAQAQVNGLFKTMGCKIGKMTERDRARLGVADDKKRAVLSAPVEFPKPKTRKAGPVRPHTQPKHARHQPRLHPALALPLRSPGPRLSRVPRSRRRSPRARTPSCPRQPIPSPRKTVIADVISSTRRRDASRLLPAYIQSAAVVDYPHGSRPPSPRIHSASPNAYTPSDPPYTPPIHPPHTRRPLPLHVLLPVLPLPLHVLLPPLPLPLHVLLPPLPLPLYTSLPIIPTRSHGDDDGQIDGTSAQMTRRSIESAVGAKGRGKGSYDGCEAR